ncbi:MAG: McrC family protein [Actinomycetota bacterium]|nr:McrC family protein [Actinomycetota bacterium]
MELDRVLFLVSYALDPVRWRDQLVPVDDRSTLVEAMAHLWLAATLRSLRRGPLQDYQRRDEAIPTVRGRIRIEEQLRVRHGLMPPVEVTYDEFTTDIKENRIVKAAALRVARFPLRRRPIRDQLAGVFAVLDNVPAATYDARHLPEVSYTRLNEHYRPAVELSKLILAAASVELGANRRSAQSFLVNMNEVFETFLLVALSQAMPADRVVRERGVYLDQAGRVPMKPDLTWLDGTRPVFVGDAKYKALRDVDGRNADLYQLLAYVVALGLPAGMLIYAAGEGEPGRHVVIDLGRRLHVERLDVSGDPQEILASVARLAQRISDLSLA